MTTHHDEEVEHYRARVEAILTPEATPERAAMTDERIAELREDVEDVLRETNSTVHRSLLNRYVGYLNECLDEIDRLRAVIAERDAEIERLRDWIDRMAISARLADVKGPLHPGRRDLPASTDAMAQRALRGDEVLDER